MGIYPTLEELIENRELDDKHELLEVRRSMLSILSHATVVIFCSITILLLQHFFPGARWEIPIPFPSAVTIGWLWIIPVLIMLEIVRKYHDDLYVFKGHGVTHLAGRLSLTYSVPMVKYVDIRAISVVQDVFGRIFDYGDVHIGTAAQDGNEMIMEGVRAPWDIAMLLDQLRCMSEDTSRKKMAEELKQNHHERLDPEPAIETEEPQESVLEPAS